MKAKLVSDEMAVHGDQWPMVVYEKKYDPENPWNGLFRSKLLIWVSCIHFFTTYT